MPDASIIQAGLAPYLSSQNSTMNPQVNVTNQRSSGSGIIGGVASVISNIIGNRQQRRLQQENYKANREMAQYQYSKDLEMWNKSNQYNSPEAQMERYIKAGLNPNLIYGTGSASAGNTATTMPKYQAPTRNYDYKPIVDPQMMINAFQDFQMRQAQIDNVKQQTQNQQVQKMLNVLLLGFKPELLTNQVNLGRYQAQIAGTNSKLREKELLAEIAKKYADTGLTGSRQYGIDIINRTLGASNIMGILTRLASIFR